MLTPLYDRIGGEYALQRKPDSRWVKRIHAVLEGEKTLLNVGAGTGSYEPAFMSVIALEPSHVMIRQRSPTAAPAVCGIAERLPFVDRAFDVALAVLTVHHWRDPDAGLAEMRRVSRKQVVVTWDPGVFAQQFWFVRDYLPEAAERESEAAALATVATRLAPVSVEPLTVPANCTDGFFGAFWRRPRAYLDSNARRAISGLALLDEPIVSAAVERLRADLDSGGWLRRYADLLERDEIDLGYRLVVSE